MPKPHRVNTTSFLRVKTQKLAKKDIINVAGVGMKVLKNEKNSSGARIITCTDFRTKSLVTLILPKGLVLNATQHKTKTFPENR